MVTQDAMNGQLVPSDEKSTNVNPKPLFEVPLNNPQGWNEDNKFEREIMLTLLAE